MEKLEYANALYEQYVKQWDKTIEQILKTKYAKEKSEFLKVRKHTLSMKGKGGDLKKMSCLHFSGKKYKSFDNELEFGEIFYKQQRENAMN